jgi:hypothetical protein
LQKSHYPAPAGLRFTRLRNRFLVHPDYYSAFVPQNEIFP